VIEAGYTPEHAREVPVRWLAPDDGSNRHGLTAAFATHRTLPDALACAVRSARRCASRR